VEVDGQTVILKGKVPSEDERRLAEGLIRLTPGVRAVRNELIVEEAARP
jgi:osmotically-inducible protein OsmY